MGWAGWRAADDRWPPSTARMSSHAAWPKPALTPPASPLSMRPPPPPTASSRRRRRVRGARWCRPCSASRRSCSSRAVCCSASAASRMLPVSSAPLPDPSTPAFPPSLFPSLPQCPCRLLRGKRNSAALGGRVGRFRGLGRKRRQGGLLGGMRLHCPGCLVACACAARDTRRLTRAAPRSALGARRRAGQERCRGHPAPLRQHLARHARRHPRALQVFPGGVCVRARRVRVGRLARYLPAQHSAARHSTSRACELGVSLAWRSVCRD